MTDQHRQVIGVGNALRGDDAFGIQLVALLERTHPKLATYITEEGDLTRIIDHWVGKEVIIIDAVQTENGKPGTVHRITDLEALNDISTNRYSSHVMNIAEVIKLGQSLNKQPKSIYFIGVEGTNWAFGEEMSEELNKAMEEVKDDVLQHFAKN